MVRDPARRGHRGDPRRRLQPHRRGQPARADAVVARHRQHRLLPPRRRRPALLHGLHRLRQHAQHAAPARAPAHHGQPALLGASRCTSTASASTWPAPWPASCYEVNQLGAFFDIIHQDPVLSQVKLIAEPWDVGAGRLSGRQLPRALDRVERQVPRLRPPLLEGRRRHRHRVRHAAVRVAATCTRTTAAARTPASTSSPATTASRSQDLVSYNEKHNEANGEENRDGANDNDSWNCGAEGPTDDPAINALRERQKRNLLATLLLSQGVPMICWPATRSATPSTATTTPTARTTS